MDRYPYQVSFSRWSDRTTGKEWSMVFDKMLKAMGMLKADDPGTKPNVHSFSSFEGGSISFTGIHRTDSFRIRLSIMAEESRRIRRGWQKMNVLFVNKMKTLRAASLVKQRRSEPEIIF